MSNGKFVLLVAMMSTALAHARQTRGDGGFLRLCERSGPYQVAVFTSPTPLRAGPVDFSVLLQDAVTGTVLSDARIVFRIMPPGAAGLAVTHVATTEAATNKLLKAAQFELDSPGRWQMEVLVDGPSGPAHVAFPAEVSAAMPHCLDMAPWILLPVVPILLFGVREGLRGRKRRLRS